MGGGARKRKREEGNDYTKTMPSEVKSHEEVYLLRCGKKKEQLAGKKGNQKTKEVGFLNSKPEYAGAGDLQQKK